MRQGVTRAYPGTYSPVQLPTEWDFSGVHAQTAIIHASANGLVLIMVAGHTTSAISTAPFVVKPGTRTTFAAAMSRNVDAPGVVTVELLLSTSGTPVAGGNTTTSVGATPVSPEQIGSTNGFAHEWDFDVPAVIQTPSGSGAPVSGRMVFRFAALGSQTTSFQFTPKLTGIEDDTGWQTPTLGWASGWSFYSDSSHACRYRRKNGIVYIKGLLTASSVAISPNSPFTLPEGHRPSTIHMFSNMDAASAVRPLYIYPNGAVQIPGGVTNASWYTFTCSFPADQ